ncbi:MAG: asparagine synthase (glutamine-hydrolyzing) [Lachnospiraceae bacterium]|nr:asparagine synthase (glutamine-hydrolyzing) [Lachnospiraceae bacterium]
MCGIAGIIKPQIDKVSNIQNICSAMRVSLRHRGPDEHGIAIYEHAALVHARLSVVDIQNGKQPMVWNGDNEEYALVYNGELYNTKELRADLISKGHTFKSYSDTEVVLHAYMEYKEKCVEYFNGIFAFAVWENHKKRLFVARDRIGVKPFFYTIIDGGFIFASEIKALLQYPGVKPRIDINGLAEIMFIGPGRTPGQGVFKNIGELLPGERAYFDLTSVEKYMVKDMNKEDTNGECLKASYAVKGFYKDKYWSLVDREHKDNFAQTCEKIRGLVIDSVSRQLISDVPVCTFLSGGLDSSIISSIAARIYRKQGRILNTVSVDYVDNDINFKASKFQPNSDASYINIMARYLKCKNYYVKLDTEELVEALYNAVDARDIPGMVDVDSSLLVFCKEIKKIATVGLSGECADEIFGGYPWYRDKEIREKYGFPWARSTEYRASFLNDDLCRKINPYEYVDERYRKTLEETNVLDGCSKEERRMKEMINLNFKWFMQTLLDRKDRMSMYNSLEVRVPFCDYRIAEYMYSVPWEYKNYKGVEKGLLREAMRGLLPNEVLWRKKSPYPKTHNPSYRNAVSKELLKVIEDNTSPLLEICKKEELLKLLDAQNETPWYGQLMTTPQTIAYFVQINYWMKKYKVELEF